MYREGLGHIDFLLGWEGKGKGIEHGKGLKKIVQKHPDELESLPETIAKGRICRVKSSKTGEFSEYAYAIVYGEKVAFLSKNDTGWAVTSHYSSIAKVKEILSYN